MPVLARLGERLGQVLDGVVWSAARGAVDAVRYRPPHVELVMACGASQPDVPPALVRWVADMRERAAVVEVPRVPDAVGRLAARAASWLGPTPSALVRWFSGAARTVADEVGAGTIERPLRARAHPGLLVPHPHVVAVMAVDMRGFSNLTVVLDDTQYLAHLIDEYLSELTRVVERHRGVVFQYTGDGFLALFLPELAAVTEGELLDRLVKDVCPALHRAFGALRERWRAEWEERGRPGAEIGLGVGLSLGEATIGFLGPSGKKQFSVIGAPANLAAFLCAEAEPGTALVDRESFARAGLTPPDASTVRLRSRKLRRRIDTVCLRHGPRRSPAAFRWLDARLDDR
jgi:class 3 adenylate cyclase